MRLQSRREQAATLALLDRLRNRITDLETEVREVSGANGHLAGHVGAAEAALNVTCAALRTTHAAVLERAKRLESQVDALRKDRDRLLGRVEEPMYSPAEQELIDAGAASKASAA
jgi:predicted  nucleic acid-binding Zn-ribbon protein